MRALGLTATVLLLAFAAPAGASLSGTPERVGHDLLTPWEIVLVPDGRTWVSERNCTIRSIGPGGVQSANLYGSTAGGDCRKYLGLALHPDFGAGTNRLVYLYETYLRSGTARSRVIRLRDTGTGFVFDRLLLDDIPSDLNHDGGRIAFGPDRKLYVTTGDIHNPALPQDLNSLNGKILRLEAPGDATDGSAPADNPFAGQGSVAGRVWSYGHRHPQGLAWDAYGRLWETEHGPSGESYSPVPCCNDEVNLIEKGANYGWPVIAGGQQREGMRSPAARSGDSTTWAPAGAAVGPDGHLYVSNLRGVHVRSFALTCGGLGAQAVAHQQDDGRRLRAAVVGRGFFWFSTDAEPVPGTERVLRMPISSDGYTPLACGPGPGGAGTTPATATTPPASSSTLTGTPSTTIALTQAPAFSVQALLDRVRTALRRARLRALLRRRGVLVDAGTLDAGRLTLRVTHGRRTVASTARTVSRRTRVRLRIALTRRGRAVLRRRARVRLVLRGSFAPSGGAPLQRSLAVTLRR